MTKLLYWMRGARLLLPWFLATSLPAQKESFEVVETPASKHSLAPNLSSLGDHFILSWIERGEKGRASMRLALWNGNAFDETRTVTTSDRIFANWADIPSVIEAPSGDLYAHWLEKISSKAYSYGIRLARSSDHGKSWKPLGWLHDDKSPTEHGFVSFVPEGEGVRAFWLDGRAMIEKDGKMMLRTALLEGDHVKAERLLDDDVCTCCPISAATLPSGPIVVYRDRTPKEIRDISFVRRRDAKWSAPSTIHADHWFMPGCPVNGSSIATSGELIAVSRYTVIENKGRVMLSLAKSGATNWREIVIDQDDPIGRCATVCTKTAVFVVWIGRSDGKAALQLTQLTPDGQVVRRTTLTAMSGLRASGMPQAVCKGDYLWVSWTDSSGVRLGRIKIAD